MDKLKVKIDKKLCIFLFIIMIIGIIAGSILVCIVNSSDKSLIKECLNGFIENINNINYKQALISNLIYSLMYIFSIWLLGISVIGLPIIIIIYFSKTFILGFSIGSIIYTFGYKGIIYSIIIAFGSVVSILLLTLLMMYAISFSLRLIDTLFKHKNTNFKNIMNRYVVVLAFTTVSSLLMVLYDTYLMPKLIGLFIK